MEAPTNDPKAGNAMVAPLAGAGAGDSLSATAAHMEAATTRAAQAAFFISMLLLEEGLIREIKDESSYRILLLLVPPEGRVFGGGHL